MPSVKPVLIRIQYRKTSKRQSQENLIRKESTFMHNKILSDNQQVHLYLQKSYRKNNVNSPSQTPKNLHT